MRPEVRQQLAPFNRTLLLDTNLLLLLAVGRCDYRLIPRFRRTSIFTVEDYALLEEIVAEYRGLVTTPNVLTEVSNLAGQLGEPARRAVFERLRDDIKTMDERRVLSREAVDADPFVRFGLTDTVIGVLASADLLVLSTDLPLTNRLLQAALPAVNFNHLRPSPF